MDLFQRAPARNRADALARGELIDVSDLAAAVGFSGAVAMTRAVVDDCGSWTRADSDAAGAPQPFAPRLNDVLRTLYAAASRDTSRERVPFTMQRMAGRADEFAPLFPGRYRSTALVAVVDTDDAGEPTITISFPGEEA